MKTQLATLAILSLFFVVNSPIYASAKAHNASRGDKFNSVQIINNTDNDVVYRMLSSSTANMYYGVKHRNSAKYHAKPGDTHMTIEIGDCERFNYTSGLCTKFNSKKLRNCVGNTYYNANEVDSITINSLSSCTVNCNDGTSTSCITD